MKYNPPVGGDPDDPYVDENPATGVDGSAVPAAAIEDPQRELINLIEEAGLTPDEEDLTQVYDAIVAIINDSLTAETPGKVASFSQSSAPTGWLKCNGAAISRTTYADLFAAIGTNFGVGDGSTTFNLPDLRGEFLRGWDDGRGIDSGRSFASFQDFAIEDLTGQINNIAANSIGGFSATGVFELGGLNNGDYLPGTATPTANYGGFEFDASNVANTASETRPRNVALLYCIKY